MPPSLTKKYYTFTEAVPTNTITFGTDGWRMRLLVQMRNEQTCEARYLCILCFPILGPSTYTEGSDASLCLLPFISTITLYFLLSTTSIFNVSCSVWHGQCVHFKYDACCTITCMLPLYTIKSVFCLEKKTVWIAMRQKAPSATLPCLPCKGQPIEINRLHYACRRKITQNNVHSHYARCKWGLKVKMVFL